MAGLYLFLAIPLEFAFDMKLLADSLDAEKLIEEFL